jgi:hypothetical protein
MATFTAIPFHADFPEFAEGKVPETRVVVDNVSRELVPHIERAIQFRADLIAIYREYRSDDLSAPCYGPIDFIVRNITMSGNLDRTDEGLRYLPVLPPLQIRHIVRPCWERHGSADGAGRVDT